MSATSNFKKYNEIISEIDQINQSKSSTRNKYIRLKKILERSCCEITQKETLQFPSLFSRLVFISQKYNLPSKLEWQLQNLRVTGSFLSKNIQNIASDKQYNQAYKSLLSFLGIIYLDQNIIEISSEETHYKQDIREDKIRVQVVSIDTNNFLVHCHVDSLSKKELIFRYNVDQVNSSFNDTIDRLWIGVQLNLVDWTIESETQYFVPKFIIVEPDYLIDASALAECFQNFGSSYLHYFRRKFETIPNSKYILQGNLSNYFLDELIFAENPEDLIFKDVFIEAFKKSPFEFTSCNDINQISDFKIFMSNASSQFKNIKRVILEDFKKNEINVKECSLEPSFFCEKFGFQGRLDLLQMPSEQKNRISIVELKSGGVPYPKNDCTKIALNHEAQTAIYRLIIQSVFNIKERDITSTILYSVAENSGENLRISVSYKSLEKEILNIRNLIVATEHDLYTNEDIVADQLLTDIFTIENYGNTPSFFANNINSLKIGIDNMTIIEKKYFNRFISFISRELYIQKIGNDGNDSNLGLSSLWTREFQERLETHDLISDLRIQNIDDSDNDMKINFLRNSTSEFVNFREGEICIVYPKESENDSVLTNQILKGTIVNVTKENILVRFRYKQRNKSFFDKYKLWAIEHDKLDHTYNYMYKGIYNFTLAPLEKRNLLLGLQKPESVAQNQEILETSNSSIIDKQHFIINKAISAKDYFLIVGPPGTGKTSIFAKKIIQNLHKDPNLNLLVIAYTNKAVDELCDAIESAFDHDESYIRIGSDLSCAPQFKHRLLQKISEKVSSRDELRNIMLDARIYVGTLASITGKQDLFKLKKFNIAIIDEASQILEPQIIGLLPNFDKFIMIGDHKQLSTITLQNKEKSEVRDKGLNNIELFDCSESYFERLYRICLKNNWTNAFDTLTYQGRMHEQISNFTNHHFYDGILHPISDWQTEVLPNLNHETNNPIQKIISKERFAFINSDIINYDVVSDKINEEEARLVLSLAKEIIKLYQLNETSFHNKTLGVITPYRNQIALIKQLFIESEIPELKDIMIDTVERFQGSQRDIIIISFCINHPYQLNFFSNLNKDKTVDRKLNVALTRARERLYIVGNKNILEQNPLYNKLIESISVYEFPIVSEI